MSSKGVGAEELAGAAGRGCPGKRINNRSLAPIRTGAILCGVIVVLTVGVYLQAGRHQFVNFDDPKYVTENKYVQSGLSTESVRWAFTARHASNWHPVTWLSHILDCELFGLNAGAHHLTNVFFHALNTVLLFVVLHKSTRAVWQSAFVAALFALHPLHVESVAWVSERKDVLSTFLWLLTLWAYLFYNAHRKWDRYLLVVMLFALGLMAKPMLVTMPFVLLVLDYWPLNRFNMSDLRLGRGKSPGKKAGAKLPIMAVLFLEKVPFFVLSAVSSVITLLAQENVVVSLKGLNLYTRAGNALVSYLAYLHKMIWPCNLAVFYPHSRTVSIGQFGGAGLILAVISLFVVWRMRSNKFLLTGWLWYIVTLVPVIGLVQIGIQKYADRYTYVPLIGIFIIIAWGGERLFRQVRYGKVILAFSAAAAVTCLSVCTWFQVGYWRNNITLYEHALAVTERNHVAHNNLGVALKQQGRVQEAVSHWQAALEIYPGYADAVVNLGPELAAQGQLDKAISYYVECLRLDDDNYLLHNNLGNALRAKGSLDQAIKQYNRVIELRPDLWQGHYNSGLVFQQMGQFERAAEHYRIALKLSPGNTLITTALTSVQTSKF